MDQPEDESSISEASADSEYIAVEGALGTTPQESLHEPHTPVILHAVTNPVYSTDSASKWLSVVGDRPEVTVGANGTATPRNDAGQTAPEMHLEDEEETMVQFWRAANVLPPPGDEEAAVEAEMEEDEAAANPQAAEQEPGPVGPGPER